MRDCLMKSANARRNCGHEVYGFDDVAIELEAEETGWMFAENPVGDLICHELLLVSDGPRLAENLKDVWPSRRNADVQDP